MAKTLVGIIQENGFEVQDSGGERKVVRCPFHKGDNEASFTIYPNGTYFCFGCDKFGDAYTFLIEFKGLTRSEASEYLGEDFSLRKEEKRTVIKLKNVFNTYRFLYEAVNQYHEFLLQTPGALNYLISRGLTLETIKEFKLGFTDGHVFKTYYAYEQDLAQEIGLLNKNGYESLSHRIIIPNLTEPGQCDFIIGRTIIADKTKYLGLRMPKPLIGFYGVRRSPILFTTEGQFDYLTLRQWGYPAVAVGGTHLKKYQRILFSGRKVIILPDFGDEGVGLAAANRLKEQIGEEAHVLDYSELQGASNGKFDISVLAESRGGQKLFNIFIKEQLQLSDKYTKWLP